jgi:hypothetical protein
MHHLKNFWSKKRSKKLEFRRQKNESFKICVFGTEIPASPRTSSKRKCAPMAFQINAGGIKLKTKIWKMVSKMDTESGNSQSQMQSLWLVYHAWKWGLYGRKCDVYSTSRDCTGYRLRFFVSAKEKVCF